MKICEQKIYKIKDVKNEDIQKMKKKIKTITGCSDEEIIETAKEKNGDFIFVVDYIVSTI